VRNAGESSGLITTHEEIGGASLSPSLSLSLTVSLFQPTALISTLTALQLPSIHSVSLDENPPEKERFPN